MDLQITARHTTVTEAMKRQATEKLSKLERHNDMLTRAEVVMNIEGERHMVEMIAHTRTGNRFVGKAEHTDMYAAIDLLLDKMDGQLKKQKEKTKDERKHGHIKASGETSSDKPSRRLKKAKVPKDAQDDDEDAE